MRNSTVLLSGLTLAAVLALAACTQPPAATPTRVLRPKAASVPKASATPFQSDGTGWVPAPSASVQATPTPLPSGDVVPLPRDQFPSDPPAGTSSSASPSPVATPKPVPVATLQPAVIESNSLASGPGAIGGVIVDVLNDMAPVGQATVRIVSVADPTQQARVRNASDGSYQVTGLAPGSYHVFAEKNGYVGDAAPTTISLSTIFPVVASANLVLVKKQ